MTTKSRCASCGAELPSLGCEGLCPRCLVRHTVASSLGPIEGSATDTDTAPGFGRELPEQFGDYQLIEEIARGGMGVVFRARQVSLNRIVAVKMMLSGRYASRAFLERFRREAESAASLQHPSIVAIHEIGEHEGQPFFSMDYVEGPTLADLVRDQPLPPLRAGDYVKVIAEAVEYAHRHGVLHRDLKPSNILIDARDQPRITDFGLAKQLDTEHRSLITDHLKGAGPSNQSSANSDPLSDLTLTGQALGSPNYMPPEQLAARRGEVGPASDVYSLGAILYHLLTGRAPFLADNLEGTLLQVLDTDPAPLRLLNPNLPVDLETICLKCLAKEASDRYASAQELADELGRFLRHEPLTSDYSGTQDQAALAFSPDGKFLAGLGPNYTIRLWELPARRERATLRGHTWDIVDLAFSSDGTLLASASNDNTARLWHVASGKKIADLRGHKSGVVRVGFSPDGKTVVTSSNDRTVSLWNLATHREVLTLRPASEWPHAVFSPDGSSLATGGARGPVELWRAGVR